MVSLGLEIKIMKLKYKKEDIRIFLLESNAIEDVFDEQSLKDALKAWKYLSKQDVLTIEVILETHKILMENQPLSELPEIDKGRFRLQPVWIGGREGIEWSKIPPTMDEWIKDVDNTIRASVINLNEENEKRVKTDHVTFEHAHPFINGNGREGRLLMLWERLQIGLPILIIKADERWKYYEWFKN